MTVPIPPIDPHAKCCDPNFMAQLSATLESMTRYLKEITPEQLGAILSDRILGAQPIEQLPRPPRGGGGGTFDYGGSSEEDGDILAYDSSSMTWVNTNSLVLSHEQSTAGITDPAHYLATLYDSGNSGSAANNKPVALALSAPENVADFFAGYVLLTFLGWNDSILGAVAGKRTGSTSGYIAILDRSGNEVARFVNASSIVRMAVEGVIAQREYTTTSTRTPEGSNFGHEYWENGVKYMIPPGTTDKIPVAGGGSVSSDYQNADNVMTPTSAANEILVADASNAHVARDRWTEEDDTNGAKFEVVKPFNAVVTASDGNPSAATAGTLLPEGAVILAVTWRITTTFGNTNGLTAIQCARTSNVGTDPDELGQSSDRTAGTVVNSNRDATAAALQGPFPVGTSDDGLTFTTVGGNFDADGQLRVWGWYYLATPPTS